MDEIDIFKLTVIDNSIMNYYKEHIDKAKEDYKKLISNNRGLDKTKLSGYYEKHHIIPECMGGTNEESNLVLLNYDEHLKAHMLLSIIYPDEIKLLYAFNLMITFSDLKNGVLKVDIILLTKIREKFSNSLKGDNNPSKRPEVRKKISENNSMKRPELKEWFSKNNPMYRPEVREKFTGDNNPMKRPEVCEKIIGDNNPSKRPEVRKKISDSLKGKTFSKNHLENLRKSREKKYSVIGPDGTVFKSASEVAKILGVNQATVNKWVKEGKNGYRRLNP